MREVYFCALCAPSRRVRKADGKFNLHLLFFLGCFLVREMFSQYVSMVTYYLYRRKSTSYLLYLLIYLLTPCSRVLDKIIGFHLVKKFPAFHATRKFTTAFTSATHRSLSCARSIQSLPPSLFPKISPSHLRLGLSSGFFPSCLPTKTLYVISPLPHMCYMPHPSHSS